jgi:hypothetical protein
MRYLREYNNYDDVKQTLKDILLEIEDEDIRCEFRDLSKVNQAYTFSIDVNTKLKNRSGFLDLPDWFIESLLRAKDYMQSNGFKTDFYIKIPIKYHQGPEWEMIDLEELIKCKSLVFTIFMITYNTEESPLKRVAKFKAGSLLITIL